MKHVRRRRHLRPRPNRRQIHQKIGQIKSTMQLLQLEAVLEVTKPKPSPPRLLALDHLAGLMQEEVTSLEQI
jgi:hypothetical protein